MNSPQSQNDAVGSIVRRYVTADIRNTAEAVTLLHRLNFLLSIFRKYNKVANVHKIGDFMYICKNISSSWLTTTGRKDSA